MTLTEISDWILEQVKKLNFASAMKDDISHMCLNAPKADAQCRADREVALAIISNIQYPIRWHFIFYFCSKAVTEIVRGDYSLHYL
ncbi:MAG TPA: hypothetical protein VIT44_12275 [Cyclobacteriaceae bacterium]